MPNQVGFNTPVGFALTIVELSADWAFDFGDAGVSGELGTLLTFNWSAQVADKHLPSNTADLLTVVLN